MSFRFLYVILKHTLKEKTLILILICSFLCLYKLLQPQPSTYKSFIPSLHSLHSSKKYIVKNDELLNLSITFWSSDFHISPINDIKSFLTQNTDTITKDNKTANVNYDIKIIDKSLSSHCHLTKSCQHDLQVINSENGINLGSCPNELIAEFYNHYKVHSEMQKVNAFICTHAASMCEVFMPFNKPLIIIASTRYEIGRHDIQSWLRWNKNLQRIADNPNNTIAANNRYDQEYIKYFTNIKNVHLLPNMCKYVTSSYNPIRTEFLLAPSRGINPHVRMQLIKEVADFNRNITTNIQSYNQTLRGNAPRNAIHPLQIKDIHELYPVHYEYDQLAQHPAIILLPYQVSIMSFFEFYRMGIPLFVPSPDLLTQWHLKYNMLNERSWENVFHHPKRVSVISKHPDSISTMVHDPNNEFDYKAVLEWISLADFYQWPHVHQFKNFNSLFEILSRSVHLSSKMETSPKINFLQETSEKMMQYSASQEINVRRIWKDILHKIGIQKQSFVETVYPTVNEALMKSYGYKLSETDCHQHS